MNGIRPTVRNVFFHAAIILLVLAALKCGQIYSKYDITEVRDVKLLEAWSYMSGNKQSVSEHWKGYFVDVKSGKNFEYELTGRLYTQFKNQYGPLDVTIDLPRTYWATPGDGDLEEALSYLGKWILWIVIVYSLLKWWFGGWGEWGDKYR
jgi:hypothetical protein